LEDENKNTLIICVEMVLMKRGNTQYNMVQAKLNSLYDCWIYQCVDHPEYLRDVLKEVYKNEYHSIIDEISMETDRITNFDKFKSNFFKILMS
jgi:hypothetical protein